MGIYAPKPIVMNVLLGKMQVKKVDEIIYKLDLPDYMKLYKLPIFKYLNPTN